MPCFNKADFAETVQTTRKVLLSRQKRMSLKINRRLEANAETMVVFLTRLDDVAFFKFPLAHNNNYHTMSLSPAGRRTQFFFFNSTKARLQLQEIKLPKEIL
jgi:hypothetical protein